MIIISLLLVLNVYGMDALVKLRTDVIVIRRAVLEIRRALPPGPADTKKDDTNDAATNESVPQ